MSAVVPAPGLGSEEYKPRDPLGRVFHAVLGRTDLTGDDWSFCYLARTEGAKEAKEGLVTALGTLGIVDALILTIALPALMSPPACLTENPAEDAETVFNTWFWFMHISCISSMVSLMLAVVMLAVAAPVPSSAMVEYLSSIHSTFTISVVCFTISCLTIIATFVVATYTYMAQSHFIAGVALAGVVVLVVLVHTLRLDASQGKKNRQAWAQQQQQQQQATGKQ